MKQMIYKSTREKEILDSGVYNGYEYVIVSYGVFPCAYVKIPTNHKYYKVEFNDIDIDVHGCLSFGDNLTHLNIGTDNDYYIGWDYGHLGDFIGYDYIFSISESDKKWTVEEIFEDVKSVINQL